MKWHKYINQTVEIIYGDRKGSLSQRYMHTLRREGDTICTSCYKSRATRVFRIGDIFAVQAVKRYA